MLQMEPMASPEIATFCINGKRNEVPVHVGAYQNDRASQVTLARHLQNLCRIVAEQQRSVGKMDAGIAFIEAGQNVRGFIQSNNRQFHIRRNGGKVDFTGLLATCQNGADAHIDGDLLGTNHTSSGVVHRLFPPCLQKKKTQSGSCVLSDRQRSASCLRFFMRWSSILRIEFSICSDE